MSFIESLMSRIAARRAQEAQAGSTSYRQLVDRLAADQPSPGDAPEHVDDLLRAVGRSPDDLARDVARVQEHRALRQRARAALDLRAEHGQAVEAHQAAAHKADEEHRRARERITGMQSDAVRLHRQVEQVEADLARALAAVPSELADAFEEAAAAWRSAAGDLARARAEAGGYRKEIVTLNTIRESVACDPQTIARLEQVERQARAEADAALAAALAYEPNPSTLAAAPPSAVTRGHRVAGEWSQTGPVDKPTTGPAAPRTQHPTSMEVR